MKSQAVSSARWLALAVAGSKGINQQTRDQGIVDQVRFAKHCTVLGGLPHRKALVCHTPYRQKLPRSESETQLVFSYRVSDSRASSTLSRCSGESAIFLSASLQSLSFKDLGPYPDSSRLRRPCPGLLTLLVQTVCATGGGALEVPDNRETDLRRVGSDWLPCALKRP